MLPYRVGFIINFKFDRTQHGANQIFLNGFVWSVSVSKLANTNTSSNPGKPGVVMKKELRLLKRTTNCFSAIRVRALKC